MTATKNQSTSTPEHFGPYEVYERVGVGGMATVHRAKERGIEGFERIVALKRLLPHLAEDESFVRSFVREAKLASMLQHPNIVQLYELGRVGAVYFISMEYIEGRDIRKLLRQARRAAGPPPLSVFIALMSQLCDALDYAHQRTDQHGEPLGLVHRDVSPSNLIVTGSGHVKVIDFGIAKAQTQQLRTQTGRIKGKLAYMAPETIAGLELDARSDIFAAGVIAHELLTARPLFGSKNEYQTIMRVQRAEVEPPSKHNPDCPAEFDDIVLMALARAPEDRWQSGAEFRDALHYLRSKYQLSATSVDVVEWMKWAFSLSGPTQPRPASQSGTGGTGSQSSVSGISPSESPSYPLAPHRAFARAPSSSAPLAAPAGAGLAPDPDAIDDACSGPTQPRWRTAEKLARQNNPDVEIMMRADGHHDGGAHVHSDEEAAEYTWGHREHSAPVLLDEVPDVSHKGILVQGSSRDSGAQAHTPSQARAGSSRHVTDFGAGIMAKRDKRTPRLVPMIMALGTIMGLGGAALYMIFGNPEPAVETAPQTATLKFVIEPASATIDILGHGTHEGSPYQVDVDAPGSYRIEVTNQGYRSYVTELPVEAGEKNVVRVALVKAAEHRPNAQVVVDSKPSGQRLILDAKVLDQRTPATLEIAPGHHELAIASAEGQPLWTHEFDAQANTQYQFSPVLQDPADDEVKETSASKRRRISRRSATSRSATPAPAQVALPSSSAKEADAGRAVSLSGGAAIAPLATGDLVKLRDPGELERPVALKPMTVLPNAVKKRSGTLPTMEFSPQEQDRMPSHGTAKLCIDSAGRVTSVTMLIKLPRRAARSLERGFKSWRYAPYKQDGQAVPACFAINFRIALPR